MAHKVFVSYKFSDAVNTREEIRKKLGNEGQYYNGEKGFTPLNMANSTIKEYLKDMIFDTSVTIVVISPQVIYSDWVDWEIRYSLRQPSRLGNTSLRNGIVCVIQSQKDWFGNENCQWATDASGRYKRNIFPQAIIDNMQTYFNETARFNYLYGFKTDYAKDYCVVVSEAAFKKDPSRYIEEAYNRAHDASYEVVVNKQVY